MILQTKKCSKCGKTKSAAEFYKTSNRKCLRSICKECNKLDATEWRKNNTNRHNEIARNSRYRNNVNNGPMEENKNCAGYLGIYIAENMINIGKHMKNGNIGYDILDENANKLDVKSGCLRIRSNHNPSWEFHIEKNTIADYFICIGFNDRKNLNPLHIWKIPGDCINDKRCLSISVTTLDKWSAYEITEEII